MRRLRVMTYNIHGGVGIDRRLDLARIAHVIRGFDPDIVALQEVDVNRARSGAVDQARELGDRLGLAVEFGATIADGHERYGLATLTRLPVADSRLVCLPWRETDRRSEPRCALVTRLSWHDRTLDMINTHLSIHGGERPGQVQALLADVAEAESAIVAGDFNCTPWSRPYRALCDCFGSAASPRSWPAVLPVVPLDHILVRGALRVVSSGVWRGVGARVASDHAPVVAELASSAQESAA